MSNWKNLPIQTKLVGACGLLVLMIVVLSIAAMRFMVRDGEQFAAYVQDMEARAAMASRMHQAVEHRAIAVRDLVLVTRADDIVVEKAAMAAAAAEVKASLEALQALAVEPDAPAEVRRRIDEISSIEVHYDRVIEAIQGLVEMGDRDAATARMNERCRPLLAALVNATDGYVRYATEASERFAAENDRLHTSQLLMLAAGSALIVALSCAAVLAVSRSVVVPPSPGAARIGEVARDPLDIRA